MKYPKINRQPRREINIPQLSGGMNLRDSLSNIRDNQMTDCVNVWYKGGSLRTRPSFMTSESNIAKYSNLYCDSCVMDVRSYSDVKNKQSILVSFLDCGGSYDTGEWNLTMRFYWQYPDKIVFAGSVAFDFLKDVILKTREEIENKVNKLSYLVFVKDGNIYMFLNNDNIKFCVYKSKLNDNLDWEYVNENDYYVPTVYTHCKRTGWDDFEGVQFEGYNLIGNKYKMVYSAYNVADSDTSHPMRYKLGQKLPETGEITIDITTYKESEDDIITVTHKISYDKNKYEDFSKGKILIENFENGTEPEDGLYMFVKYNYVGFLFESEFTYENGIANIVSQQQISCYACNEDNVVITAPYNATENNNKKVFGMTQSAWFGGVSNGINGGSRLFLCGNNNEEDKALIVWSSIESPLYFPENNYVYVGDKSQGVITFGQQGENLIIFKEKSTYYTYYMNDNITADDLINQTVIDYEANSVCFPIVQLNTSIGCDCPNTVQLCRNRLVWANSDGGVYTLFSNNQYSERTIYRISDMIYSELSKENDLKNAVSCDFEGHYLLATGKKIYVMDYNSYGYQYASSFSKNEDSNAQIPWYIWICECSDNIKFYEANDSLTFTMDFKTEDGIAVAFLSLNKMEKSGSDIVAFYDEKEKKIAFKENKIYSKIQTKLFDFSAAGYMKNIDRVGVSFGNNGGAPICVWFISNAGSDCDSVMLDSGNVDERSIDFVDVKNFYPTIHTVRTFGVKIECEGLICIEGLSIQYRLLGGVK